jgi:hypothetical protein
VPALTTASLELLADAALRARFAEAGRDLVRREFSTDQMVEGNLAVYRELVPVRLQGH